MFENFFKIIILIFLIYLLVVFILVYDGLFINLAYTPMNDIYQPKTSNIPLKSETIPSKLFQQTTTLRPKSTPFFTF